MKYDAIIIGAGMSGLAAGIRLAHFGSRVCILERHSRVGGLSSYYRVHGRELDVGLHAITNYAPKGARTGPLARVLKQLRLRWDDFDLSEQIGSRIIFPGVELAFSNDLDLLRSEIERKFPRQKNNFQRLLQQLVDYDDFDHRSCSLSTREIVGGLIDDPLLVEMLLCPVMWYGNAREHDMDFGQFCILFRSIYLEGLARPHRGVRPILDVLVRRFRDLGGELRLRAGVAQIQIEADRARGVVLDNGEGLEAEMVISSAGILGTMRLCGSPIDEPEAVGQISCVECISILDQQPRDLGFDQTIVFYNDSERFHWEKPNEPCDLRTGAICSPNNFDYVGQVSNLSAEYPTATNSSDPFSRHVESLPYGVMRITALADPGYWLSLPKDRYKEEKARWHERILASAVRFIPDFRGRVIDVDAFTPRTIRRFTGHANGAVYGSPRKHLDGKTHLENLFVCGTDQGFVGVIGSIMGGIVLANRQLMRTDE